jgi:hypothetical protein
MSWPAFAKWTPWVQTQANTWGVCDFCPLYEVMCSFLSATLACILWQSAPADLYHTSMPIVAHANLSYSHSTVLLKFLANATKTITMLQTWFGGGWAHILFVRLVRHGGQALSGHVSTHSPTHSSSPRSTSDNNIRDHVVAIFCEMNPFGPNASKNVRVLWPSPFLWSCKFYFECTPCVYVPAEWNGGRRTTKSHHSRSVPRLPRERAQR